MNTPQSKQPKIRSMPGQVYQLTKEDLTELRLRQQALMNSKALYLLAQQGYTQYVGQLLSKYGIEPMDDDKYQWGINLDSGEIAKRRNGGGD